MNGYVFLHKKIMETSFYKNPIATRLAIHCLLKANHKDKKTSVKYQEVLVKRGQFLTGRKALAWETGLSEKNIRTALFFLSRCGFFVVKPANRFSIITIIKYDDYQIDTAKAASKAASETASKRPASGQQAATIEELKELKEPKEHKERSRSKPYCPGKATPAFLDDSPEISLSKYLFEKLQARNPKEKEPNFQVWAGPVDLMLRLDNRTATEIQQVIDWSQGDEFWQNNIASTAKLRKQFDALWRKMESGSQSQLNQTQKSILESEARDRDRR